MKKTDKKLVEEFIRVDHAGERGAIKIYEGQLLALKTIMRNDKLREKIEEMKIHEQEHSDFFEKEIKKRNIKPTREEKNTNHSIVNNLFRQSLPQPLEHGSSVKKTLQYVQQ